MIVVEYAAAEVQAAEVIAVKDVTAMFVSGAQKSRCWRRLPRDRGAKAWLGAPTLPGSCSPLFIRPIHSQYQNATHTQTRKIRLHRGHLSPKQITHPRTPTFTVAAGV
jgi:hypothetical protein